MKENNALELAHQLHHLEELLEVANDPKLLWEEMQILGKKAFTLQEKMEHLLDTLETQTQEVSAVQTLFETRERMWDIMNQLASAELKLKEKTLTKNTPKCHKDHNGCCCHEQGKRCCHQNNGKDKKCQKK